jgi:hypothetical protein
MTISEYIGKMKSLADEMASAGKALEDEELVSYVLVGLDFDINSVVSTMVARVEPISMGELHAQLLSFEAHWELTQGGHQALANAAQRGRGGGPGPSGRGGTMCGCGRGRGGGSRGGYHPGSNSGGRKEKIPWQVCGKVGNLALDCWHRFDETYTSDNKSALDCRTVIPSR